MGADENADEHKLVLTRASMGVKVLRKRDTILERDRNSDQINKR